MQSKEYPVNEAKMKQLPICDSRLADFMPADLFKALSDPNRVAILWSLALSKEPRTVGELAQESPVDVSVVSRHLKQLRDVGIVACEKTGKEVRCRVRYGDLVATLRNMANAIEACCPNGVCPTKEDHHDEEE
jgi:DNA-binding transcriptional ArsR family regulator